MLIYFLTCHNTKIIQSAIGWAPIYSNGHEKLTTRYSYVVFYIFENDLLHYKLYKIPQKSSVLLFCTLIIVYTREL